MIAYKYFLKKGQVDRKVFIEYVTEEKLNLLKNKKVDVDVLYDAYLSYKNGIANKEILEIENRWYNAFISKDKETYLALEKQFAYLKGYRGLKTSMKRKLTNITKLDKDTVKEIIRYERDLKVRNYEDSIADLAKLVSFSFSTQRAIYSTLSETAKGKIPTEVRGTIEYALDKFGGINTRADRQLKEEGTQLIDRLLESEKQIADIIDNVKSK